MKTLSSPRRMKSMPLGWHVLNKEIKRDVSQRAF
jgi:hypothetical protein